MSYDRVFTWGPWKLRQHSQFSCFWKSCLKQNICSGFILPNSVLSHHIHFISFTTLSFLQSSKVTMVVPSFTRTSNDAHLFYENYELKVKEIPWLLNKNKVICIKTRNPSYYIIARSYTGSKCNHRPRHVFYQMTCFIMTVYVQTPIRCTC